MGMLTILFYMLKVQPGKLAKSHEVFLLQIEPCKIAKSKGVSFKLHQAK